MTQTKFEVKKGEEDFPLRILPWRRVSTPSLSHPTRTILSVKCKTKSYLLFVQFKSELNQLSDQMFSFLRINTQWFHSIFASFNRIFKFFIWSESHKGLQRRLRWNIISHICNEEPWHKTGRVIMVKMDRSNSKYTWLANNQFAYKAAC